MVARFSPHTRAVLQALFVTFLWSTSWILIKVGLQEHIPALTFAGLRYCLAVLCLLPLLLRQRTQVATLRRQPTRRWLLLVTLGILLYSVTQGAQFIGLASLPSITVNLLLSLTTLLVSFLGVFLLREQPTRVQWLGLVLYAVGVIVYFYPIAIPTGDLNAIAAVLGGVVAGALAALIGRAINRSGDLSPLAITTVSMGIGAPILLIAGVVLQGFPALSPTSWAIIVWLALVNTAFAFTSWNHTLRTLSAMESSIINNMMMVQIPLLAWVFLGEGFDLKAGIGFTLAGIGILVVQLRRLPIRRRGLPTDSPVERGV